MKRRIMMAVLGAGLLMLAACQSQTPQQQAQALCIVAEMAACAQSADPMTNRAANGQCIQQGAQACGLIPPAVTPAAK